MDPLNEYLMEKHGGQLSFPGMGRTAGDVARTAGSKFLEKLPEAGATMAVGAGVAVGGIAAAKIYDAVTKRRDFRSMMASNQDLEEEYARDPKMFNQAFTTLRRFTPEFSKDPLIAGTYMRQMMSSPATAGGVAVSALSAAKDVRRPGQEPFFGLKNKFS
jgi:hypothetical protein